MTLAVVLLGVLFTLSPLSPASAPFSIPVQSASTNKPADTTSSQDQNNPPSQNSQGSQVPPSQSTPANPPAAHKSAATQKPHNKKKDPAPPDCTPAESATPPASQDSAQPTKTASDPSPGGNEPSPKAPATPCPLPKVVVKQGGTSEPSIQIVGGTDNAPARAASQYLQSADDNLKKLAGRQLSSSERNVVTQIHQFMDQSKTATAAGDLESARTLAWKAQVLSENLVNPDK